MIPIYFSLAVSEGVETAFAGLKKKKKKPVSHIYALSYLLSLDLESLSFSCS